MEQLVRNRWMVYIRRRRRPLWKTAIPLSPHPSHHPSPVVSSVLEMKSDRVADQHNSTPVIVDNMVIRRWRKTVNSPNFYMQSLFKAPLGVTCWIVP